MNNAFWLRALSRLDLLRHLKGDETQLGVAAAKIPDELPQELLAIWPRQPSRGEPPAVVVVESLRMREFLAWIWTYVPSCRPFTAYCRVLDLAGAKAWIERDPTHDRTSSLDVGPLVGLILAEAAVNQHQAGFELITPAQCLSTHSYVLARVIATGLHDRLREVNDRYREVRQRTGTEGRLGQGEALASLGQILSDVTRTDGQGRSEQPSSAGRLLLAAMQGGGSMASSAWRDATEAVDPELSRLIDAMEGPREDRVVAVARAIELFRRSGGPPPWTCALGYLVSQIAPGSLDHLGMLVEDRGPLREAVLWYGVFAGIHQRTGLLDVNDGLGRRLGRELRRPLQGLEAPRCDIAVGELDVALSGKSETSQFRVFRRGQLEVELIPGVSTVLRWPPSHEGAPRDPTLFDVEEQPEVGQSQVLRGARELLGELDFEVRRLGQLRDRVADLLDSAGDERGRRPRRKGRR